MMIIMETTIVKITLYLNINLQLKNGRLNLILKILRLNRIIESLIDPLRTIIMRVKVQMIPNVAHYQDTT